jgi:hypothetical protein
VKIYGDTERSRKEEKTIPLGRLKEKFLFFGFFFCSSFPNLPPVGLSFSTLLKQQVNEGLSLFLCISKEKILIKILSWHSNDQEQYNLFIRALALV